MAKTTHSLSYSGLEGAMAALQRAVITKDFIFTAFFFHMAFERHNFSEKLDNGETEAELKNYLPQIREMIESTVPGTVAHPYQQVFGIIHPQTCSLFN